jgi:hypothetical protein
MGEEVTEEPGTGKIPWTVGDVARGIGLVIGLTLVIAFGLGIGTVLLIGPDVPFELGSLNISQFFSDFLDILDREGLLQQWLIIAFVGMLVGEAAMPLSAWLFSIVKYKCGWRALGFRPFNVRNGLILAALVVAAGLLISFLYDMLMTSLGEGPPSTLAENFTQTGLGWAIIALLAVVVAPIAEETFFRGFLFTGIGERYGYSWGAVLSALLFAVAHFIQPGALLPIFILGLLLAWLYIRTGSIWTCIFAHFAYNSLALLFMI